MEGVGGGQSQGGKAMQVEKSEKKENNNEEELQLFFHHLDPLSQWEKLVLIVAGPFLVPIRYPIHPSFSVTMFEVYMQIGSRGVGDAFCLVREWLGFDVQGQGSL